MCVHIKSDGFFANCAEHSVAVKPNTRTRLNKAFILLGAAAFILAALFLIGIFAPPFLVVIPMLAVLAAFIVWLLWKYTNKEYDYLIAEGVMQMCVVYGGRKRGELFSVRVAEMTVIADFGGKTPPEAAAADRQFFCVSSMTAPNIVYAAFENDKGKKCVVYFEATKKALGLLKFYNSSSYKAKG